MKSAIEQLSTYKSVHLNNNNIKTHFVGVPLIIWSIALILAGVNFEFNLSSFNMEIHFSLAAAVALVVLVYYFVLSIPLALMSLILFGPLIYSVHYVAAFDNSLTIAITVFVIGWIIQFIGHHFEKAKPAFVDDLNQLFIGPLFLIAEIYFYFGQNKIMADKVRSLAIEKRKIFEEK